MTDNLYMNLIIKLKSMDEKQLLELCHDIEDIDVIDKIANCFDYYAENFDRTVDEIVEGKSELEDWKHQDDALRYLDYKSTVEL